MENINSFDNSIQEYKESIPQKASLNKKSAIQNYISKIKLIKTCFERGKLNRVDNPTCLKSKSQKKDIYSNSQRQERIRASERLMNLSLNSQFKHRQPSSTKNLNSQNIYVHRNKSNNFKLAIKNIDSFNNKYNITCQNFHRDNRNDKNFTYNNNRFVASRKRVATEMNQCSYDSEAKDQFFTTSKHRKHGSADFDFEQVPAVKHEAVKKQILQKISLYVKSLDERGQAQLNEMLTNDYRRRKKSHNDTYMYQCKIRQMIQTNKQMVKILKQQFLDSKPSNQLRKGLNATQLVINPIISQELNKPLGLFISSLEQDKVVQDIGQKQVVRMGICTRSQNLVQNQTLTQSKQNQEREKDQANDQNQIQHVTKQFINEWQKSQNDKQTIYQKFRKSIFQRFPQIRERQHIRIKNNQKQKQNKNEKQIPKNSIQIRNNNKQSYKKSQNQVFKLQQNKVIKTLRQQAEFISKTPKKYIQNQRQESVKNKLFLSRRNSFSKESTKSIDTLSNQDKQQVKKINFSFLVQFIFKRAFFYSISKNRVIQNKIPYQQIKINQKLQQKNSNISFLRYNAMSSQKQYLRTKKLNRQKLNANGRYLIKNKFNIMNIQKQGKKSFIFLKKCLDDAVDDYLKQSKKK